MTPRRSCMWAVRPAHHGARKAGVIVGRRLLAGQDRLFGYSGDDGGGGLQEREPDGDGARKEAEVAREAEAAQEDGGRAATEAGVDVVPGEVLDAHHQPAADGGQRLEVIAQARALAREQLDHGGLAARLVED